jgi:hypothetical protein
VEKPRAGDHMKEPLVLAVTSEYSRALRQLSRHHEEAVHHFGDGEMTGLEKIRFVNGIVQCEIRIRDWYIRLKVM